MTALPVTDTVLCSGLIKYRREHPLLGQKHFLDATRHHMA